MHHDRRLTTLSLLSIVLMAFHVTGDVVLGFDRGAASLVAVGILVVWLGGTLMLAGRVAGYVIMLLGGLTGVLMPALHFRGRSVDVAVAAGGIGFFYLWGLFAIGATGAVAAMFAGRALWSVYRARRQEPATERRA